MNSMNRDNAHQQYTQSMPYFVNTSPAIIPFSQYPDYTTQPQMNKNTDQMNGNFLGQGVSGQQRI